MTIPRFSKKTKRIKPCPPISEAAIQLRAHELWQSRTTRSAAKEDWDEAKSQLEQEQAQEQVASLKGFQKIVFWLNRPIQPFLYLEKRVWEPWAELFGRAAFFQVIEKLSPAMEAVGVLLIPLVVWGATQSYQFQKDRQDQAIRQQDAIKNYLSQLTTIFLDGKIKEDSDLQNVTRASTLTLLKDPSLDGRGKGQVIRFLSELELIAIDDKRETDIKNEEAQKKRKPPVISLARADLSGAILFGATISSIDLSSADLSRTKLSGANLIDADLSGAFLFEANLSGAKLRGANLRGANLTHADLMYANLDGADLNGAILLGSDFRGANLRGANLSFAFLSSVDLSGVENWDEEQLAQAKVCKVKLPAGTKLNPDRDCKELEDLLN